MLKPDNAVYGGTLPDGQNLNSTEVQFQFSVKIALAAGGLLKDVYAAYTQLSFWQLYRDSAYFRETDYQPELLIAPDWRRDLGEGWVFRARVSPYAHQSNGRGGSLERSWDRTMADLLFHRLDAGDDGSWTLRLRPWIVWRDEAYRRYNPDMTHYLGYGRESAAYERGSWRIEAGMRNQFESGFKRGSVDVSVEYALNDIWSVNGRWFNGFGQSLIEYNHAANALGLGFSLHGG